MKFWFDTIEREQLKHLIESNKQLLEEMKSEKRLRTEIAAIQTLHDQQLAKLNERVKAFGELGVGDVKSFGEAQRKLEALELWKAELMRMLTETSAAGRPKLNATGRWLKKKF